MSDPALVPELLVSDLPTSLQFWRDICGFRVRYERPEEKFAYLGRESAHLMLEQLGEGRHWITGPLEAPFGRGINFQISLASIGDIEARVRGASLSFFLAPEEHWYRAGGAEAGVRQFVVQDPDGYLVRFSESLGKRRPMPVPPPSELPAHHH